MEVDRTLNVKDFTQNETPLTEVQASNADDITLLDQMRLALPQSRSRILIKSDKNPHELATASNRGTNEIDVKKIHDFHIVVTKMVVIKAR